MSEFDQNTQEDTTSQDSASGQSDSVYSYRHDDINQGENDTSRDYSSAYTGTYYNPYQKQEESPKAGTDRKGKKNFAEKLMKVTALALVFGLVAGAAFSGVTYGISKATGKNLTTTAVKSLTSSSSVESTAVSTATTVTDVSDIVSNVMPAIVAVTNISYTEYRSLFGQTQTYENESAGSGIIISQDNEYLYIASNNHVVSGAETLTITFNDGSAVPATVKGTDASVDLAVVAVALSDIEEETMDSIKVATLGESDDLQVGESSVVIGNALGYGQSVTTGVISALSREVQLEDEYGNVVTSTLMQTDAAVNPGNSGGALLNMNGEVVGIVSAKYTDTKVEGMGYAIPISTAKSIMETIINQEVVSEDEASYFGIAGVDVSSDVSKQYDMPTGVYVTKVASGSGASKAGIQKGDIILSFNGRTVTSMEEISGIMQYLKAGTKVEVVIAQASDNYQEKTIEVTLTKKK